MIERHWKIKTEPAADKPAVTLANVKLNLRITASTHDTILARLTRAAERKVERDAGVSLINQAWYFRCDRFPFETPIYLPRGPVSAVDKLEYVDTNGDTQTLAADQYETDIDSWPPRIVEAYGCVWPSIRSGLSQVRIEISTGYGADSTAVPEDLGHAVTLLASHWFLSPEPVSFTATPQRIQLTYDALIHGFKANGGLLPMY